MAMEKHNRESLGRLAVSNAGPFPKTILNTRGWLSDTSGETALPAIMLSTTETLTNEAGDPAFRRVVVSSE